VILELEQVLPMLELSLFRNRCFSGANGVMALVGLATYALYFYISVYMQQVLGYSPLQAGASVLPWTAMIILFAPLAGRLSDRYGPRGLVTAGMVTFVVSTVFFSRLEMHSHFPDVLPSMLLGGLSMAITMTPTTSAGMSCIPLTNPEWDRPC